MKRIVIAGSILIFGVIVGITSVLFSGVETWRGFGERYIQDAGEQIYTAKKIRSGKSEELAREIDKRLPLILRSILSEPEFRRSPNADAVLWHARDYYQKNNIQIPDDIKAELDPLPLEHPTACTLSTDQYIRE